jgi:hypothetical protein
MRFRWKLSNWDSHVALQYDGSETVDVFFPPEKALAVAVDDV